MTAVMEQAREMTETASAQSRPDGVRRCLVCGEMLPRAAMIRFVIAPDSAVVADLSEKLPGHGLWVSATRDAVNLAVKKNLFAKAAKMPALPSPGLSEDVAVLLRKRCLDLLGLAKGAGIAVLGETQTESALRSQGKLALFLRALDATAVLDNRFCVEECSFFDREELGAAFGYHKIVYAGLAPHRLTQKIKLEIKRVGSMTLVPSAGKNEG